MKTQAVLILLILFAFTCSNSVTETEPESGFAEVNGTKLWYEVAGLGEPILFIHGNFGDLRHWDFQVESLSKLYKVIRYDVRGYGKSALPDTAQSYRDCDDIKALMDYLEIEKANICGVSMGSGIAVDFALAFPDRCISLIPIGPWANGTGVGKYRTTATDSMFTVFGETLKLLRSDGPKAATDYWWMGNHEIKTTVQEERTLDSLLIMGYQYSWWGFLNPSKRMVHSTMGITELSSITLPTLIVTAEFDIEACKEVADLMQQQIANSKLISIEGAGHLMNMDNPTEFNRIIQEFVGN
jgi:pimeloyl-ACP methyl ester carboxylesterase